MLFFHLQAWQNRGMTQSTPHTPNTIEKYFTKIWLGLKTFMKNVLFWNSLNCLHLEIVFNHIYPATFDTICMTMV